MMKMENEMNVNVPLEVIKASEIEPKEVKWLWYPYIPLGFSSAFGAFVMGSILAETIEAAKIGLMVHLF